MVADDFTIIEYEPAYQFAFEQINKSWFRKHFKMEPEPVDEWVLTQPEAAVIQPGGIILLAIRENEVAGTLALKRVAAGTYEFTKMAVLEEQRGKGLGKALAKAAIRKARSLGAQKIILYSHSSLQTALSLYQKLGFKEIPLDQGTYSHLRCDTKMELTLDDLMVEIANPDQASVIAEIGKESFEDAFGRFFNKTEDLKHYLEYTYQTEKIKASIGRPNNIYFLASHNLLPVGFAKFKKQSIRPGIAGGRQTELQKIYLLNKWHGMGAGQTLLQAGLDAAKEWNPESVWLDVLTGNHKAFHFYEKNGFIKKREHSFKIGSQTFEYDVMVKPIAFQ